MRERWGTFSVQDHMTQAPFVSDVLLYDRLIIPVPPEDGSQDHFWKGYNPELQKDCLGILNKYDNLALTVPWDSSKRERFKNQMSTAAALATQQRSPDQDYYIDPFDPNESTRQLIKGEFLPSRPPGVIEKPLTVAAYPSEAAYQQDAQVADPDRRRRLAALMTHHFLTPEGSDPDHKLLEKAVRLATKGDFRRKRTCFYDFQEKIITEEMTDQNAIEELERRLNDYNESIRSTLVNVCNRFIYTLIPVALPMTHSATLATADATGIVMSGIGGLVSLHSFYTFNRTPNVEAGDLDAAAMIHDARREISFTNRARQ